MTTTKTLQILHAIEDEATAFEDSHGYDPDNQATLELAHEMIYQIKLNQNTEDAFDRCFNSYRDALEEAQADKMERIK